MLLIVWCLVGLAGWWWLLRRSSWGPAEHAPAGLWHVGDAVFAALLGLGIIWSVVADDGKPVAITTEVIQGGISFYVVLIGLFSILSFRRGQNPQQAYGLGPAALPRVLAFGVVGLLLTYPFVELAEDAAIWLGRSASDGDEMVQFFSGHPATSDAFWAIVLVVLVAPITEELLFRGYIYGVLRKYVGRIGAMLTSALLFAAMHHNLPAMPALFLLAIGLTLAYEVTGSLWTSIVMHLLFNLVPVVVILRFPEWMPKP